MKLFLWDDVGSLSSGMVVVLADSVEKAREQAYKEFPVMPDDALNEEPDVYGIDKPEAFVCWGGE